MGKPSEYFQRVMASGEPQLREVGTCPWTEEHPGEPLPQDAKYDPELLETGDRRNVLDKYRYWKVQAIKDDLDLSGRNEFEVLIENWTHDFNIGSIVRTANAFAAAKVHMVGPHKWNRKGALMTELYQHIEYHPSIKDFHADFSQKYASVSDRPRLIAMDIVPGAQPIERYAFPKRCILMFGAEGPGLSEKALEIAHDVVYISQFGSVRSINAGAAAAVSMHAWMMQHAQIS